MKSVVLCGSSRYEPEMRRFARGLKKLGVTVYEPYPHPGENKLEELSKAYQEFVTLGLAYDHIYKIKMADIVYIYNKDGYSGVSTTLEIGASLALNKPIYAYSGKDDELCRLALFREIIKSPRKLLVKLK